MKHILTPILLLVFLFPSLALSEEVTFDDLVNRDGLFYKKDTDIPFSGKVTIGGKDPYQEEGTYKKGLREGPFVSFHNNGQLKYKGSYKDGKVEGAWEEYYDKGQLMYKGNYKDGKKVSD